jgi:hypothetical protein
MASKVIEWKALEHHHHQEKTPDWFWIVGTVTVAGAILSIYFGNVLFGVFILIACITAFIQSHTKPEIKTYRITRRGVQIGKSIIPYSTLESFWVIDEEINDRIILKSQKVLMPYIVVPFDSMKTDPDEIRNYLLDYLHEEEMDEPFLMKFIEYLGF